MFVSVFNIYLQSTKFFYMDYNLKEDVITTKSSTVVKLSNFLTLTTTEETIDLRVEIVADFENIPHK